MNYNKTKIKNGITFHKISTNKFKTNLFAIFLTTPITRETVTKNALIGSVLRRGTNNIKSQEEISKELENMYGATFDCGVEKNGDNQVLKFYIESLNNDFLPTTEDISEKSLKLLADIVFNPYTENGAFKPEYVENEKNTLKQLISGKIDDKTSYSLNRCIEEMYKGEPYGLYKFGYIEDLENINEKNLYEQYLNLIQNCKIDIFVSGFNMSGIDENQIFAGLSERNPIYIQNTIPKLEPKNIKPKEIVEKMDVTQGKLMLGLNVNNLNPEDQYATMMYDIILGGGANSKLFQNVREKASLAYFASAGYVKQKSLIVIRSGIEIKNYEKALAIIKDQLSQMKSGDFTQDDLDAAKQLMFATIKSIPDNREGEVSYYFSRELMGDFISLDEYLEMFNRVTVDDVARVAKLVEVSTVFFLTGGDVAE